MSYLVLARKWRPKTFGDIVGQPYIAKTLQKAVLGGKLAHAIVFSGPRGVGKTSTARIVAKALNCAKSPSSDAPCSECTYCREIEDGRSLDVIEIDAASHTGVNDIREIIDNIKYLPSSGKNKVYIIDEFHMLSQSAMSALLKTLEEPPPNVYFVLATTEAHKIPLTILSRCQRYEFKKVPTELVRKHIEHVTRQEKISVSPDALYIIAEEADGSLRDALGILDQLIATFGTTIKEEDAVGILSITDRRLVKETLKAILGHDPRRCIEILGEASAKGVSPKRFSEDLLKLVRHALIIKACGKSTLHEISSDEADEIESITADTSLETLELLFKQTLEGAEEVHRSAYPKMALEATIIKLSLTRNVVPIDEIIEKVVSLEDKLGASEDAPYAQKEGKTYTPSSPGSEDFLEFVKARSPMLGAHLDEARRIYIEGASLCVEFAKDGVHPAFLRNKKKTFEGLASEYFKRDLKLRIEVPSTIGTAKTEPSERKTTEKEKQITEDPLISRALDIFGGKIIKVKPPHKEQKP
ncbi:MAG: DNA polymerase III subunit gamma/tau [Candidatus Methanosuratincola sp.]